jgi:hypothetical protein
MKQTHGPPRLPLCSIFPYHLDVTASGIYDLGSVQVALPTPTPRLSLPSNTLTKPFDENAFFA